jgi:hypothetical protein
MSSFTPDPISASSAALDPSKHVNFTLGMVLGVDDFNQEFAYLSNRDQWQMRDLIGYGTACGLDVTIPKDAEKGLKVRVSEGVALNPRGQFIRVNPAQCAVLANWLEEEQVASAVKAHLDKDNQLHVYLTLCYRDCLTDSVPVPGEPCRTEDAGELLQPSRVQDNFSLALCLEPPLTGYHIPDQEEENALRSCVAWLRLLPIRKTGSKLEDLLDAFHKAAADDFAKPPQAKLVIPNDQQADFLRRAFLLWTTEIRPTVRGQKADCVTSSEENCVLLAELTFAVSGSTQAGWSLKGDVTVDESRRPYLLHLRMLQEWLLTTDLPIPGDSVVAEDAFALAARPSSFGTAEEYSRADHTHGLPPDPIPPHQADPKAHTLQGDLSGFVGDGKAEVIGIHNIPVAVDPKPTDFDVLRFIKDHWEAAGLNDDKALVTEQGFGQSPDAGKSNAFARADHTHGTPTDPIPAHVQADSQHKSHKVDGDVTGVLGKTVVEKIRGQFIAETPPKEGQFLQFDGKQWVPVPAPTGGQAPGAFVQRSETAGKYAIVAAGVCRYLFDQQKGVVDANMEAAYNGLEISDTTAGKFGPVIFFKFRPVKEFNNLPLIIKLTPVNDQDAFPRVAWVTTIDGTFFGVGIAPIINNELPLEGRLMIEVSQFEPDGGK